MVNISLLEMGRTKKRGVRETVIEILSGQFPLNIRKLYGAVKKDYGLDVSYQAVFKAIKEMVDDKILVEKEREYQLNIAWISGLKQEISIIEKKYLGAESSPDNLHERVNKFLSVVGPKVKTYFGKDEACVVGLAGGGKVYGMGLWKYFTSEGMHPAFALYDVQKENLSKNLLIAKQLENRKLVIVCSATYTGDTYRAVLSKLNKFKKKLKIKDIKYAVDQDMAGIADFAVFKP